MAAPTDDDDNILKRLLGMFSFSGIDDIFGMLFWGIILCVGGFALLKIPQVAKALEEWVPDAAAGIDEFTGGRLCPGAMDRRITHMTPQEAREHIGNDLPAQAADVVSQNWQDIAQIAHSANGGRVDSKNILSTETIYQMLLQRPDLARKLVATLPRDAQGLANPKMQELMKNVQTILKDPVKLQTLLNPTNLANTTAIFEALCPVKFAPGTLARFIQKVGLDANGAPTPELQNLLNVALDNFGKPAAVAKAALDEAMSALTFSAQGKANPEAVAELVQGMQDRSAAAPLPAAPATTAAPAPAPSPLPTTAAPTPVPSSALAPAAVTSTGDAAQDYQKILFSNPDNLKALQQLQGRLESIAPGTFKNMQALFTASTDKAAFIQTLREHPDMRQAIQDWAKAIHTEGLPDGFKKGLKLLANLDQRTVDNLAPLAPALQAAGLLNFGMGLGEGEAKLNVRNLDFSRGDQHDPQKIAQLSISDRVFLAFTDPALRRQFAVNGNLGRLGTLLLNASQQGYIDNPRAQIAAPVLTTIAPDRNHQNQFVNLQAMYAFLDAVDRNPANHQTPQDDARTRNVTYALFRLALVDPKNPLPDLDNLFVNLKPADIANFFRINSTAVETFLHNLNFKDVKNNSYREFLLQISTGWHVPPANSLSLWTGEGGTGLNQIFSDPIAVEYLQNTMRDGASTYDYATYTFTNPALRQNFKQLKDLKAHLDQIRHPNAAPATSSLPTAPSGAPFAFNATTADEIRVANVDVSQQVVPVATPAATPAPVPATPALV